MFSSIVDVISSYIKLKPVNGKYFGLCPFHNDTKASLCVFPKTQTWYCFGCGAGSKKKNHRHDTIGFVMAIKKCSYKDACECLKGKYIKKTISGNRGYIRRPLSETTLQIYKEAAEFYHLLLMNDKDSSAYKYLTEAKGYSNELLDHFQIGLAYGGLSLYSHLLFKGYDQKEILESNVVKYKNNKLYDFFWGNIIIYPHLVDGNIIAFTVKDPDEKRDLRWKLGRNDHFYNQNALLKHKSIVIVEGENDLLGMNMQGKENVIALCGTYFGSEHQQILKKYEVKSVSLALDDDEAGWNANNRIRSAYNHFIK